jgi:hypothetical protein
VARRRRQPLDACAVLNRLGIAGKDFFVLPASKVSELLEVADAVGYRKPKNANGSRGRYFHAYLERRCR